MTPKIKIFLYTFVTSDFSIKTFSDPEALIVRPRNWKKKHFWDFFCPKYGDFHPKNACFFSQHETIFFETDYITTIV